MSIQPMRTGEASSAGKRHRKAYTGIVRDAAFRAALSDRSSPIVQRRSGKAPRLLPAAPPTRPVPGELLLFGNDCADPAGILEDGKLMARALAAVQKDEQRLALARSFGAAVIKTYWFEAQREY